MTHDTCPKCGQFNGPHYPTTTTMHNEILAYRCACYDQDHAAPCLDANKGKNLLNRLEDFANTLPGYEQNKAEREKLRQQTIVPEKDLRELRADVDTTNEHEILSTLSEIVSPFIEKRRKKIVL